MNNPVRQHWVPRAYLKNFAIAERRDKKDPQVYVYDLQEGVEYCSSIANVTVKKHLYTIYENGNESFQTETFLSELEGKVAPLLQMATQDDLSFFEDGNKNNISLFLATLFMRNRSSIQHHENLRKELSKNSTVDTDKNIVLTHSGSRRYQYSLNCWDHLKNMDETGVNNLFSKSIITTAEPLAKVLKKMQWALLTSVEGDFITSDIPFVIFHPEEDVWGIATPGVHIHIAISPKHLLYIAHDLELAENEIHEIPVEAVDSLNGLTMERAERKLIGRSDFNHMSKQLFSYRNEFNEQK